MQCLKKGKSKKRKEKRKKVGEISKVRKNDKRPGKIINEPQNWKKICKIQQKNFKFYGT